MFGEINQRKAIRKTIPLRRFRLHYNDRHLFFHTFIPTGKLRKTYTIENSSFFYVFSLIQTNYHKTVEFILFCESSNLKLISSTHDYMPFYKS